MRQMTTVRMTLYSLFMTLIAVGAFLQIPLPNFDCFMLQFFFVLMAGMLLGTRLGALSTALHMLIGLLGIPVFTAGGGVSYILRPSFRFLFDFVVTTFCSGWIMQHGRRERRTCFLTVLTGLLVTYGVRLACKYVILNHYTGTEASFSLLLLSCFPLDLPKDILCNILATYVVLHFLVAVCRDIKQERVYARQIQK